MGPIRLKVGNYLNKSGGLKKQNLSQLVYITQLQLHVILRTRIGNFCMFSSLQNSIRKCFFIHFFLHTFKGL